MQWKELWKPIFDEIDFEKAIATPAEVFQKAKLWRPVTYVTEDWCFQVTKILDSFMCDMMNKVPGTIKTTQEIEDECDSAQAFRRAAMWLPKYRHTISVCNPGERFDSDAVRKKIEESMLHRDSFIWNGISQKLREVYIQWNREVSPKNELRERLKSDLNPLNILKDRSKMIWLLIFRAVAIVLFLLSK